MTAEALPPASVIISGPGEGYTGQTYDFMAAVEPPTTTLPLTYTWEATGQEPIIHTAGLTDTVSYTWEIAGDQHITVTAGNASGSVMDTHLITLASIPNEFNTFLPCALRACQITFSDDFSDPNSGWAIIDETDYSMEYYMGHYRMSLSEGWIAWSLLDFGVSDYRVEVDVLPVISLDGGMGIFFSATEDGFYLFEIIDGYYSLWRTDYNSWNWIALIDWTYSSTVHPGYQTNRLAVERQGSQIKVYANNVLLGTVSDSTYLGTLAGMAVEAYFGSFDGSFDNFLLSSTDCLEIQGGQELLGRPVNAAFINKPEFVPQP